MNIDELLKSLGKTAHVVNELLDLTPTNYDTAIMDATRSELAHLLDKTASHRLPVASCEDPDCLICKAAAIFA